MLSESDIASKLYAAPILVVDDDSFSLNFIERSLRQRGFQKIYTAQTGEAAVEHIKQLPPELVILDIAMPGISGIECCQWIRSQAHLKDLPVLMLTSMVDTEVRVKSFEAGATDFVCKPLHPDELYGRVKVHLVNRLSMKSLQSYKRRLDGELQSARDLQSAILPNSRDMASLREQYHLDVSSHLSSSSEIGGDLWGIKTLTPDRTAIWIVDFSGHGVGAALNAFRMQAYLNEYTELSGQPGEYLTHLNEKLLHLLLRGHFATMFYGVMDARTNRLNYACACSPHPLILKSSGKVKQIDGSNTPLGVSRQRYETQSIEFRTGDTLVLYSDALTETADSEGRYITEADLSALLSANKGAAANDLKEVLLNYFKNHSNAALRDDLTLCVGQRLPENKRITHFQFSNPDEIYELASSLAGYFPTQKDALVGIYELLLNALEHGNLSINKMQKRQLLQQGLFSKEMERLLIDPQHVGKSIKISIEESETHNILTIEDEGLGFDWKEYLGAIPNAESLSGRGLLIALRCGFDSISYNADGNAVTCSARR